MTLALRDVEYVENRLSCPAVELSEAIERLHAKGEHGAAARLRNALSALMDECRAVRDELRDQRRREREATFQT